MKKEQDAEEIFKEAEEKFMLEEEESDDSKEGDEEFNDDEDDTSEEIFKKKDEETEKKIIEEKNEENQKIEITEETQKKTTSEEFWVKKETELEKQLKAMEEGDALNRLFDDDSFDEVRLKKNKLTKAESIKLENTILLSWPTIGENLEKVENEPVLEKKTSILENEEIAENCEEDFSSVFNKTPVLAKKPWMR